MMGDSMDDRTDSEARGRVLGIVGGMGPESTLDYYRMAIDLWPERAGKPSHPHLIIDSLDGERLFELAHEGRWVEVGRALERSLRRLGAAGAGSALIASNTAHLALDAIADAPAIPVIHIADATAAIARESGARRLGVFGTRYTMTSSLYPSRLQRAGIEVVTPTPTEMDSIHDAYYGELVKGQFRDATRSRLIGIIGSMRDRDGIDGLILGGTELALILREPTAAGVPLLNTAGIHVEAGLDWLAGG